MYEEQGNIWDYHKAGYWVAITTNGFVKRNGECVMGRGTAHQAARMYPSLPKRIGTHIENHGNRPMALNGERLLTFPVKHNWWERADLNLIRSSFRQLIDLAILLDLGHVVTPRPGCGNGHLSWDLVKPALEMVLELRREWKDQITIVEIK